MTGSRRDVSDAQLFATGSGFMGAPWAASAAGAKAAILGVPFDCGTQRSHRLAAGPNLDPRAIAACCAYESEVADFDIREVLGLLDCGDVVLTPGRIADAFERIEEAAWRIVEAGATPIGFGGDGSISVPLVRAAARKWPKLSVLHVDSHTDCHPVNEEHPYDAASQFSHVALEQRVLPSASYHVGIRGSTYRQGVLSHTSARLQRNHDARLAPHASW